jgi:hypothetical protein
MPFNFGAFAGGMGQGLQQGAHLALQAEEHKLRAKMIKNQLKKSELEQQQQDQQQLEMGKYVDMLSNGMPGQPPAPLMAGQEGPEPAPDFQIPNRPANPAELLGQAVKSVPKEHRYNLIQESMKQPRVGSSIRPMSVGVGGTVWDPATQQEVYRNPTERVGIGVEPQMLNIARKIENGTASPHEINLYNQWPDRVKLINEKRGEGVKQGGLNIEQSPAFQANITQKEKSKAAGEPVPPGQAAKITSNQHVMDRLAVLRQNYDPAFLGMLQGTDIAFEARRRGIGPELAKKETTFRQELNNLRNAALYDASGTQINEQEQKRIANVLPKATDTQKVFEEGLERYEAEVAQLGLRRADIVKTPRGEVGKPPSAPAATKLKILSIKPMAPAGK